VRFPRAGLPDASAPVNMSADTLLEPPSAPPEIARPHGFRIPALLDRERLRLTRWTTAAILAALFLVSLWLRLRTLHVHYWIDEALSVGIASHPLGHIPALMHQDGSPPLYYMLLHVWIAIRGHNEVATHELSLIFAMLTIPAAYWAGSSLFDRRTGVICAVLAGGAPYLTQYGEETRMYALLALLSLVVAASFVHTFVMRNRRYLPVFVVSMAAALYTHNWALFLGLMAGAAFLLCVLESAPAQRPTLWRDGVLAFGGVAVLYAPWVPTVLYQAKHTGAPWTLPPVIWSLSQGAYSLVGGRGAAVALLLGGGAGLLALRQLELARAPRGGSERSPLLLAAKCLLVLGLGTMLLAWVYAKITPSWAMRYLAVIVGPLILLFGLGLARGRRLAMVALALTACFWILDPVPTSVDSKSNVATAVAKVRRQLGPNALVLSTQPEQVPALAFYLPRVSHFGTPLGPVSDPRVVDWRDALARFRRASERSTLEAMLASLAPGERVLLVVPARQQTSPVWFKLINRFSAAWSKILSHDHALRRVRTVSPNANKSGLPVQATLYVPRT
jgi:mannosyltransferase